MSTVEFYFVACKDSHFCCLETDHYRNNRMSHKENLPKAPAKRSQHANTTCRNIVGRNMLRMFGHRVEMCCDMLGVVGSNLTTFKSEPTTPNMSQHIATRWPHTRNMLRPTMFPGQCCDMFRLDGAWKRRFCLTKLFLLWRDLNPHMGSTPKHLSLLFLIVCPSHHRRATQAACLLLKPPHTSRFLVGRQKNFTCRLECDEFRLVCDKFRACRTISDSTRSQNLLSGLVGDGQRQFVGAPAYLNPRGIVMRVTWTSVFSNMAENDSATSLNAVSRDKKIG